MFCGEEGEKSKNTLPPIPHPCYIFRLDGKVSLSPALPADVELSYSFVRLFIPGTSESFLTIPKVLPAHVLYPQALGGIKIFFFVCLYA